MAYSDADAAEALEREVNGLPDTESAHFRGQQAYPRCEGRNTCPHMAGSDSRSAWLRGWDDAAEELARNARQCRAIAEAGPKLAAAITEGMAALHQLDRQIVIRSMTLKRRLQNANAALATALAHVTTPPVPAAHATAEGNPRVPAGSPQGSRDAPLNKVLGSGGR